MKHANQIGTPVGEIADFVQGESDRRRQDRHIAMLRLAKIRAKSGEGWGFIKNLSATGMMVEVHSGFELGDRVSAFLNEDQELTGSVRWRKQSLAGVMFSETIDIAELLSRSSVAKNGRVPRLPRVEMQHPINLYLGSRRIHAEICDISPSGICVKTGVSFEIGKKMRLAVSGLMEIEGAVRWQLGERVGIIFSQRLPLNDLMSWLSALYRASNYQGSDAVLANVRSQMEF